MLNEQNNSDHENWYQLNKVIGNGSFGIVHEAFVIKTHEQVAIKKVLQDPRYKNRELSIMKELSHPNIIQLRDYYFTIQYSNSNSSSQSTTNPGKDVDSNYSKDKRSETSQKTAKEEKYLNLVMEYVPETVHRITRNFFRRCGFMPINLIRIYAFQLCRAFGYLHSMDICHRDLKPHNLLVDPLTNVLKLCDFGSAKRLVKGDWSVSYICSRFYRAPELMLGANEYTTAIDSWSIGCVLSELILGRPLFCGDTSIDQLVKIIQILGTPTIQEMKAMNPEYNNINFPNLKGVDLTTIFPKNTDLQFIDLIYKFLRYDPTQRLKPLDALTHPFFLTILPFETRSRISKSNSCSSIPKSSSSSSLSNNMRSQSNSSNTSSNSDEENTKERKKEKQTTLKKDNKKEGMEKEQREYKDLEKKNKNQPDDREDSSRRNNMDQEDYVVDVINLNLVPGNLTRFTREEIKYMSQQTRQYFRV